MTLVKHEFGPEAIVYLRRYLDKNQAWGKRLGKLLARRDLESGKAWSFVPSESSPETLADLEEGALYPDTPLVADEEGHKWQRKHDPWDDLEVIEWLDDLLAGPGYPPRIACSEDVLARRTDTWVAEHPGGVFFCGDDVYTYATADGSFGDPVAAIGEAAGHAKGNPSVGMVTTLPPELERVNRQSLDEHPLEEMAAAAIAVIVGAWDQEGLVFWESATGPRGR